MNDLGKYLLKNQRSQKMVDPVIERTRKIASSAINKNNQCVLRLNQQNKKVFELEEMLKIEKLKTSKMYKLNEQESEAHSKYMKALAEQQAKEQQSKEQQAKEQEAKEQEAKEQQAKEQEAKEQEALIVKRKFVFSKQKNVISPPKPEIEIKRNVMPPSRDDKGNRKFVFLKK